MDAKMQSLGNNTIATTASKNQQTKSQLITKEEILKLYFEDKLKQCEIAKLLKVSKQYVSKVILNDSRFSNEKKERKRKSMLYRKEYQQNYQKNYKRKIIKDDSKEILKVIHENASRELSGSYHYISNDTLVYSNISAYHINKKGNLVLNKNINATYDIPRMLNRHRKVPTQKQKFYTKNL